MNAHTCYVFNISVHANQPCTDTIEHRNQAILILNFSLVTPYTGHGSTLLYYVHVAPTCMHCSIVYTITIMYYIHVGKKIDGNMMMILSLDSFAA